MPEPELEAVFFGPMVIARDFEAAYHFYKDTIGLRGDGEIPYAEFRTGSGPLVVLDEAFWIGATSLPPASPGSRSHGGIVLAIKVRSVDETYERLSAQGVHFPAPPSNRPQMGLRILFLHDPDGNLVELSSGLASPRGGDGSAA
jgi:catechol 2,3-dioxygenase-like lactoylglutathione lyase family enzyme